MLPVFPSIPVPLLKVSIRDSYFDVVVWIKPLFDEVIGYVNIGQDMVKAGIFTGSYLYYVSTFLGLPAENGDLLLEKIGIFTEELHPYFIDFLIIKPIKEVKLFVSLIFRGHIAF